MASSNESALDLRTIKLAPDPSVAHPASLPPFSFCFSPSHHTPAHSDSSLAPFNNSTAYFMTERVLAAAFTRAGKPTRPFKAYPKNPLSLTVKTVATKTLDNSSDRAYLKFRQRMLVHMSSTSCTKTSRPSSACSVTSASGGEQDESRDNSYWDRRRKNNEAAKRSRDARRAKEDEIAIRAAFLEQENLKLKCKVVTLTNELTRLRYLLYGG